MLEVSSVHSKFESGAEHTVLNDTIKCQVHESFATRLPIIPAAVWSVKLTGNFSVFVCDACLKEGYNNLAKHYLTINSTKGEKE